MKKIKGFLQKFGFDNLLLAALNIVLVLVLRYTEPVVTWSEAILITLVADGMIVVFSCLYVIGWKYQSKLKEQRKRAELTRFQMGMFPDQEIPDKLTVNAAFDKLIESGGQDAAAIETALKFFSRVPPSKGNLKERTQWDKKPKNGIRGWTPGFGAIEIKDDKPAQRVLISNRNYVRVGQYKVWRRLDLAIFRYFWKSDLTTALDWRDTLDGYAILFDPPTFEYKGFGETFCAETDDGYCLVVKVIAGEMSGEEVTIADIRYTSG